MDTYAAFKERQDWPALLSDGLHLSAEGNKVLFARLQTVITSDMPQCAPDALALDMPWHDVFQPGTDVQQLLRQFC